MAHPLPQTTAPAASLSRRVALTCRPWRSNAVLEVGIPPAEINFRRGSLLMSQSCLGQAQLREGTNSHSAQTRITILMTEWVTERKWASRFSRSGRGEAAAGEDPSTRLACPQAHSLARSSGVRDEADGRVLRLVLEWGLRGWPTRKPITLARH